MNTLQFKMIFRGWMKNKIYTVISILSLTIGLTAGIMMTGFVNREYRIAGQVKNADNWYLIKEKNIFYGNSDIYNLFSRPFIAPRLMQDYPEVQAFCMFRPYHAFRLGTEDKEELLEDFFAVSPVLIDVFQTYTLYGDLKKALEEPGRLAITRSYARELFGREDVVGESFTVMFKNYRASPDGQTILEENTRTLSIYAVMDDSKPGFLKYNLLSAILPEEISLTDKTMLLCYSLVALSPGTDKDAVLEKIRSNPEEMDITFTPLKEVYFESGTPILFRNRDKSLLYIGITIAFAVLLISCFNYINISLTRSHQKLRQTSFQMAFGASLHSMKKQLLLDTTLQVLVSLILAAGIIDAVLPLFNQFVDTSLSFADFFFYKTLIWIAVLLILVIWFPSLYVFNPIRKVTLEHLMKKEKLQNPGLISGMVIAQFAISIILLIFMMHVRDQMKFIAYQRPEAEKIIHIRANTDENSWQVFHRQLTSFPGIEAVTGTSFLTEARTSFGSSTDNIPVNYVYADEAYFDFYGIDFIDGKPFDFTEQNGSVVVVNEALVKKMGIDEPVGNTFSFSENGIKFKIQGVVCDFPLDKLTVAVEPLIITRGKPMFGLEGSYIKVAPEEWPVLWTKLEALWVKDRPDSSVLEWKRMSDTYREMHKEELNMLKMVNVFSWMSVLLTLLGLFGLASYSVEIRSREIALRKINGATSVQILSMICRLFLKWIVIAFVLALPVAFYLSWEWLSRFVFRTELNIWIFVLTGIFALLAGLLTIIRQSWCAARKNPVKTLRLNS